MSFVLLFQGDTDTRKEGIRLLGPIVMSVTYYTTGLFVIYRYHQLGIYVVGISSFTVVSVHALVFFVDLVCLDRYSRISMLMCYCIFGNCLHYQTSCT